MANKTVRLDSIVLQIPLFAAIILCLVATYLTARWCFGSTLAEQAQGVEAAQTAISLSPSNPLAHQALAAFYERTFLIEDLPKALREYEKAVALSPQDYRLWLALGRSRERNGDPVGAEKALRQAAALAPNYAEVHWFLGNQLLRQGNDEEAFVEIRRAVELDNVYANQAVTTAWQIFDGDINQISRKIGDSVPIKAGLAPFLAKQGRLDEALVFWNSVPEGEMATTYKSYGDGIFAQLIGNKDYKKALALYSQMYKADSDKFSVGEVFNGDFERDVKTANAHIFDWQIAAGQQPQIGLDGSQKHGGGKSLVLLFNSQTGEEFRPISQTIVVEGGKTYKFEAFYRSELKTAGTVQWEIVNTVDGKVLAATQPVNAASDWSPLTVDFTVPNGVQAITVRLARAACKQSLCPISGKIWFDDINLK